MIEFDYELLNEKLEQFIFEDFPIGENDISFVERICDIILDNPFYINFYIKTEKDYATKNKISLDKVISINLSFFEEIDSKYSAILKQLITENCISFEISNYIEDHSYIDTEKSEFKIMLLKNIEDVLRLGHEFMHYLNCRKELSNKVTSFYTECLSNYCELKLVEYIIKKFPQYKKDSLKMKRNIFTSLYEETVSTKILLLLLKKKINGITINDIEFSDIIGSINDKDVDINLIITCISEILEPFFYEEENLITDYYLVYTRNAIALPLACYMYENYQNKEKQIFELGDYLHEMKLEEVLLFLDLEFKEENFDLTEESYEKIEKSYQKSLKNLW